MQTNAYMGGGGSEHDQKYAFCMQVQLLPVFSHKMKSKLSLNDKSETSFPAYECF